MEDRGEGIAVVAEIGRGRIYHGDRRREISQYPGERLSDATPAVNFHARQTARGSDLPWRKDSGCCLARLLNRLQKFQQVGVDFILMGSRQAVRPARIVNFLCSLDELGRLLR